MDLALTHPAKAETDKNLQLSTSEERNNDEQSMRPILNNQNTGNIDQSSEAPIRKARVSVRARSEASVIADGCQWRKYGQKNRKRKPMSTSILPLHDGSGVPGSETSSKMG